MRREGRSGGAGGAGSGLQLLPDLLGGLWREERLEDLPPVLPRSRVGGLGAGSELGGPPGESLLSELDREEHGGEGGGGHGRRGRRGDAG